MKMEDQRIIEELREGNTSFLKYCYKPAFKYVQSMIKKNGGTPDDAKDIFHDSLIVLNNNCKRPEFRLTSALSTYLYAVSRHIWFNQRKKRVLTVDDSHLKESVIEPFHHTDDCLLNVLMDAINKMGGKGKEILLDYYYGKFSYDEIADSLGYSSGHVVRQQKYRCIQKLRKVLVY
ncbi:MAG: sigma-70 family RNA polymerase sigma factor [Cyclobacteriaceae bacterium]